MFLNSSLSVSLAVTDVSMENEKLSHLLLSLRLEPFQGLGRDHEAHLVEVVFLPALIAMPKKWINKLTSSGSPNKHSDSRGR